MRKCTIERVDNGWIVTVTNEGVSNFKARYDKPKIVFTSMHDLQEFLATELSKEKDD